METLSLNNTIIDKNTESKYGLVVFSSLLIGIWFLFLSFYLSRVLGKIITIIVNRIFLKDSSSVKIGYLKKNLIKIVGSLSVSIISGKIMFSNVKYYCTDYSIKYKIKMINKIKLIE